MSVSRDAVLWTCLLLGPFVWLCSFQTNFSLNPWACTFQNKAGLFAVSLTAIVIVAVAGFVAYRQWAALGLQSPGTGGTPVSRARAMAMGGVLLNGFVLLILIAQAIGEIGLGVCD